MNDWDEIVKKINLSNNFVCFLNDDSAPEIAHSAQIGIAMQLDKPIIVVAKNTYKVPKNFEKVAAKILRYKTKDDMQKVAREMANFFIHVSG